jgi:hypothetical protein
MKAINTYFCNRNFSDVRLVGAPSIGKFGSDTDNWVWRHTGDFSLFRIYADKITVQQNIQRQCVILKNTSYLFRLTVLPKMISRLFWLSGKPTNTYICSHRTNCKRTQSKIEIRDKALKVADGFMRKTMPLKFNMPLNMLVLLLEKMDWKPKD